MQSTYKDEIYINKTQVNLFPGVLLINPFVNFTFYNCFRTLVTSFEFPAESCGSSVRTSGSSVRTSGSSVGSGESSVVSGDSSSTLNPAAKTTLLQVASQRFSAQPTNSPALGTVKPSKRKYKRRKVKVKYFENGKFEIRNLIGVESGEEIMETTTCSKVNTKPEGRRTKKKLVKKLALSERRLIHCRNGVGLFIHIVDNHSREESRLIV